MDVRVRLQCNMMQFSLQLMERLWRALSLAYENPSDKWTIAETAVLSLCISQVHALGTLHVFIYHG